MAREKQFNEAAVLEEVADLFTSHGYQGTSLAMLLDATGLTPFFDAVAPRTRRRTAAAKPAAGGDVRPADLAALARFVLQSARAVLGAAAGENIPADQPLNELGLDSLMALELRKTLGRGLGLELPATLLFSHPSTEALTAHLGELLGLDATDAVGPPDEPVPDGDVAAVQAMSEAEMAALIEREFALAMADDVR